MLIDITNTCLMGCPHCLQRSTEEPQHMTMEIVEQAYAFGKASGANAILISGGEPTMHPEWEKIVRKFCAGFFQVSIISNGHWLFDPAQVNAMIGLLKEFGNLVIQITSVDGLYKDHQKTCEAIPLFKVLLKRHGLKHRIEFVTGPIHMISLGRACEHEEYLKQAKEDMAGTTSCFVSALAAAQCNSLAKVIENLEPRGKFCHPLVDWKGNLHWSESWLCPHFAHVSEPYADIERKALSWRPCGGCPDYVKFLERKEPKYVMAKMLMAMKGRPL